MRHPATPRSLLRLFLVIWALAQTSAALAAEPLPFTHKVEVYRDKEGDIAAFAIRLEQPFLAEEFERSNFLRLSPLDRKTHLIYPKETRFQQKHAEFFGRMRGEGAARLRLTYEVVSENPDGSRRIDLRQGDIEIAIPETAVGPSRLTGLGRTSRTLLP